MSIPNRKTVSGVQMLAHLEDITVGSALKGVSGNETVSVVAVKKYGPDAVEVTYKRSNGKVDNQVIYRQEEDGYEVLEDRLPWSFDADGESLRLVSEAYRIELAHLFDPYLAVHTSSVEPLPHQISAVYQEMLPRLPLRYILADDPGAGKTIMTGLLMKELIVRGDLKRCLVVAPGNLAEQWQDELYQKFGLRFEILTNDKIESAVTGNVFTETNFCIARLDKLSRDESLKEKLSTSEWDLIVCDEAHKMAATIWAGEIKYTKRFQLGQLLSTLTRNFLLLTATPHNGKDQDFQLFLSLIDPDRFEGAVRTSNQRLDVSDVMRRLVKEELLKFDGSPLFPERIAYTVNYDLSPLEARLYEAVTDYVEEEFNRADKLTNERKTTVGFALTILQRRLASSPEAIYQSLRRRRERLEKRLAEAKAGKKYFEDVNTKDYVDDVDDFDDIPSDELEAAEDKFADQASAAATITELEAEIETLRKLERMANEVRMSGTDRKWDELSKLLQENEHMFGQNGQREKLIIFTEHRDTLNYLDGKIRSLLGDDEAVVTIHGGMSRDERRRVETLFKQDSNARVLVATDAAGEGVNLQRAHLMINYDLPWNPNRIEQRFGRVHRIGQTEVCYLWNLVSKETREGAVFERLFSKLEEERVALGGKVFDILGKMTFDNKPLRELLIEAIRHGRQQDERDKLNLAVDSSFSPEALRQLMEERALTEDVMDRRKVMAIREDMERADAHRLQPHFIEEFFVEAFKSLGGTVRKREHDRYEITSVPYAVRNRNVQGGFGAPIISKYERICFDKDNCNLPGQVPAELICPGHPLLDATISVIREQNADVLKRGAVLIDEQDDGTDAKLLFYIEDAIQDGRLLADGSHRIISKDLHFIELKEDGTAINAGYAPYLDLRAAKPEEYAAIRPFIDSQQWLTHDVEEMATTYAISTLIPEHFFAVKSHRTEMADKTAKAVKERLTAEIQYWDYRAGELKQKEAAGKQNAKLNSMQAARRADELKARMDRRLAELEEEKKVSPLPPAVIGGALVIPMGLVCKLTGTQPQPGLFGENRREIELAAMKAVMDIETKLGYSPTDVSARKVGYDIESAIPDELRGEGPCLRFIEVKGRAAGAQTVTVSKNEILYGLNSPDEFILALVEVDRDKTRTRYLKNPFRLKPDYAATSVNYDIAELLQGAELLLEEES